jgi:mannose-6-phosphate isomerase
MDPDYAALARQPVFFERNRVFRVYEGGKLFADFFGDEPVDGNLPEEWIASSVKALNRDSKDPEEGQSLVRGTRIRFADLLRRESEAMLGAGGNFNVLVKALDSAIRLPIQAHPDKEFSRRHFKSDFGKTEMWLVLATRPGARIYFGFDHQITKAQFSAAIEASLDDKDALTGLLNEVKVEPGEVYLIPARSVHAIGYGCLILEVQEPTDFTIQPEYWCGGYRLNDYEMYLGLPKEVALDCFDFGLVGAASVVLAKKSPRIMVSDSTTVLETLIDSRDTPCFSVERLTLRGSSRAIEKAPSVCIVTHGEGGIAGPTGETAIAKGDYFFMPHAAKGRYRLATGGELQVVSCYPPIPGDL